MPYPDFSQSYFELFDLPQGFSVDSGLLGERYRQLQRELHPDRFAGGTAQEQRLAVQYSGLVNQAYNTLKQPLSRALYLLELAGWTAEEVSRQQIDGGFLIEQMELREKLESLPGLVDRETVLEHLLAELAGDIKAHQNEFVLAYDAANLQGAASACVKMQYLGKLLIEAEQVESDLLEGH
jgi:molecular chaperone HscB